MPLIPSASSQSTSSGYGGSDSIAATQSSMQLLTVQGPVASNDPPLLEIRRASRRLRGGRILFQNISHTLWPGSLVILRGPSGAGKSQLLRLVASLRPPEPGTELLLNKSSSRISITTMAAAGSYQPWRRHVRYVSQHRITVPGTPRDLVRRVACLGAWRRKSLPELTETTMQLMQEFGLEPALLDKEWKVLSGGESQRVQLALALASRPTVLLMDESTSALDRPSCWSNKAFCELVAVASWASCGSRTIPNKLIGCCNRRHDTIKRSNKRTDGIDQSIMVPRNSFGACMLQKSSSGLCATQLD